MRSANLSTVQYVPNIVPQDKDELIRFLTSELSRIKIAIDALAAGHLDQTNVAPTKPRDGDIRYADGTNWNPGSGVGIYYYKTSAWVLLG